MLRASSIGSGKIGHYFLTCMGNFVDFLYFSFMIFFHVCTIELPYGQVVIEVKRSVILLLLSLLLFLFVSVLICFSLLIYKITLISIIYCLLFLFVRLFSVSMLSVT